MNIFPCTTTAVAVLALLAISVAPTAFARSPANAKPTAASLQSRNVRDLHPGDRVRLNSGGPLMTVDSVQGDNANCLWAGGGEVLTATVPIAALTIVGGPGWLPSYAEP
jgi:uncharacterized protein YodC (DUF2158 family)